MSRDAASTSEQNRKDAVAKILSNIGTAAMPGAKLPSARLTLLFTDIEGSTQLLEALGEQYSEILDRQFVLLRQVTSEAGGEDVVAHGDAYFAIFDRPATAVAAAVKAQRLLYDEPWPNGMRVRVRMGLHTGNPQAVADPDIGYIGLDVHRAARICEAGHGGQILLSSTTRGEIEGRLPPGVSLRELGTHRLKDIRFPETLTDLVIEGLPDRFGPVRSLDNRPSNLPTALTPFIGRSREKADLQALLRQDDLRMLTLTGAAGTGKTRLSIEVAADMLDVFRDGVFQVPLAAVTVPRLVPPTIAETMGVPEFPGRPVLESLKHAIAKRRMLLVIDNFEQVVAAAPMVVDLLNSCPRLKVLLTSREALGLPPEREYQVAPLQIPTIEPGADPAAYEAYDAVRLFVERVRDIRPDFALTAANAPVIAEICRRLDGLPLAIELAASRLRLLDPPALLERLSERLEALGRDDRGLKGRHQTLRNAIGWSYDLLDEAEQRLFCRTSIFTGGFSLQAAEAVCLDDPANEDILDKLTSLVRKSLLQRDTVEGEPRLSMLETMREYGHEQLRESGEHKEMSGRHLAHMLAQVEAAAPSVVGPDQRQSVGHLLTEADNVRAALEHALEQRDVDALSRCLKSLLWLWIPRGQFTEGEAWVSRALIRTEELAASRERAIMFDVAGWLRLMSGDWKGALPLFQECRPIYEGLQMANEAALALMAEGITKSASTGDPVGLEQVMAALAKLRVLGDTYGVGLTLTALGESARLSGEQEKAQGYFEEALACMRAVGNIFWTGALLGNLAHVRLQLQNWTDAVSLLKEALDLAREYGDPMLVNLYVAAMGQVALIRGRPAEAAQLFGAADAFLRSLGVTFEPADQTVFEQNMTEARGQLGKALYEQRFREGAQWSKEQAIDASITLRA
jgi:predicted ATPase/class 3 adenylate cyclase